MDGANGVASARCWGTSLSDLSSPLEKNLHYPGAAWGFPALEGGPSMGPSMARTAVCRQRGNPGCR